MIDSMFLKQQLMIRMVDKFTSLKYTNNDLGVYRYKVVEVEQYRLNRYV